MVATVAANCVIGADLGGTKLLVGVIDQSLGVHHRIQDSVDGLDGGQLLKRLAEMVEEAAQSAPGPVLAAGFGVAGILDRGAGVVAASPHLPLAGMPFAALIGEQISLPVAVDNDGNCAMLAEWRAGAAKGLTDAVMLTVGTGIGGGIVANAQMLRGSSGGGAEFGHMVVELDGPPCVCGGRGHYEWYASGRAIGRAGQQAAADAPDSPLGQEAAAGREISGALVTEMAHGGDGDCIAVIGQIGRRLGQGMVSITNIFNPQMIVVGGGAVAAGDLLLEPARAVVAEQALGSLAENVTITAAKFGADAGLIGAAMLAFDQLAGQ